MLIVNTLSDEYTPGEDGNPGKVKFGGTIPDDTKGIVETKLEFKFKGTTFNPRNSGKIEIRNKEIYNAENLVPKGPFTIGGQQYTSDGEFTIKDGQIVKGKVTIVGGYSIKI
ncbi:MAG: hypothetical protein IIC74_03505, partial [Bacteroidetes bacterium]|nr:hypothetical protein [Bacteroidota bacterium]